MRGYHGNTDSLSVFLHWSRAGQRESSQPKGPTVLRAACAADTGKRSGGRDSVQTHPSLPCWGTRGLAVVAVSVCVCVCARVCAANSTICSCVACPSAASRISTLLGVLSALLHTGSSSSHDMISPCLFPGKRTPESFLKTGACPCLLAVWTPSCILTRFPCR